MSNHSQSIEHNRRRAVEAALANAWLEGMEPTPETAAILDSFVAGQIDGDEMIRLIAYS